MDVEGYYFYFSLGSRLVYVLTITIVHLKLLFLLETPSVVNVPTLSVILVSFFLISFMTLETGICLRKESISPTS